jgi:O-antigen ligase
MTISATPPTVKLIAVLTGIAVPCLVFGRVIMALPLILAVLLLVWFPERRQYWRALLDQVRTPIGMMVLVTLALWLPSMVVSPLPLRSMEAWVRVPVFIGLIFFLSAMLSERQEALALALKALIITGTIATLFALFSLTFLPEVLAFFRLLGWSAMPTTEAGSFLSSSGSVFSPHNILKSYGALSVLMVPVLVWAGWRTGAGWRGLVVATVVGLLAVVWLTYNRSAIAGLFVMAVVFAGLMMLVYRRPVIYVASFVFILVVMVSLMLWLYETRFGIIPYLPEGTIGFFPSWLIDYQRQMIWDRAFDFGMDAPWFGNGINAINFLPGADAPMPRNNLNIIPAHPHNWLVEVFAETGAIGAFALLTVVITLCLKLAGDFLRYGDTALLAALMVNVGYWGSGLLNFSFWSAWWQVSYLLMTAFCLAGRACLDKD